MKIYFLPITILFACSFAAGMNNSDVLRMFKGNAPTSEIIKNINSSEEGFLLFPDDVQRLLNRGVPRLGFCTFM